MKNYNIYPYFNSFLQFPAKMRHLKEAIIAHEAFTAVGIKSTLLFLLIVLY